MGQRRSLRRAAETIILFWVKGKNHMAGLRVEGSQGKEIKGGPKKIAKKTKPGGRDKRERPPSYLERGRRDQGGNIVDPREKPRRLSNNGRRSLAKKKETSCTDQSAVKEIGRNTARTLRAGKGKGDHHSEQEPVRQEIVGRPRGEKLPLDRQRRSGKGKRGG